MVKMRDLDRFCSGQSNCSEIWRFINFFDMMAVRHLGFVMHVVWTTCEEHLVVFIVLQNVIGISAVVLIICVIFDFTSSA